MILNNIMKKKFSFIFPITQGRVHHPHTNMWSYDHITNLVVTGIATHESTSDDLSPSYDIEGIWYEGVDVLPLLKAFNSLQSVKQATEEHVKEIFRIDGTEYLVPEPIHMNHGLAKVISLPLRKRIN